MKFSGEIGGHDLHGAEQGRGFPIALRAEPVAVSHQSLDGQTGQLAQPVKVLESCRESGEPPALEEAAQGQLDAGGFAQRLVAVAVFGQCGRESVGVRVLPNQGGDGVVGNIPEDSSEIANAVSVDRKSELHFRGNLVAFSDSDLTHVVAEADKL